MAGEELQAHVQAAFAELHHNFLQALVRVQAEVARLLCGAPPGWSSEEAAAFNAAVLAHTAHRHDALNGRCMFIGLTWHLNMAQP